MRACYHLLLLLFCCTFLSIPLAAQQITRIQSVALNIGVGVSNESLAEDVTYFPLPAIFKYSVCISNKKKKNHLFFFHVEPQWNSVLIIPNANFEVEENPSKRKSKFEWETGVNLGFSYQYFYHSFNLLLGFGSGPHYISVVTSQQANGFIFSDNFFAGIGKSFASGVGANLQVRFRHVSNAGLKNPNYGIDNLMLLLGISKSF